MMSQVKRKVTSCAALALAAALGLAVLAVPARALEYVDPEHTASLTVSLSEGASDEYSADLAKDSTAIPLQVFKVAGINMGGTYYLEEGSPFANTSIKDYLDAPADWKDARDEGREAAYWREATVKLLKEVYPEDAFNDPETEDTNAENTDGVTVPTLKKDAKPKEGFVPMNGISLDADGYTTTIDLDTGLYLVVPLTTETARYEYRFTPMLVSVPQLEAEGGAWNYAAQIFLKMEQKERLGYLLIKKELASYNASFAGAGFVFEVVATVTEGEGEEPQVVYRNYFSLKFSTAGEQQLLVKDLPVGAKVTVTEVYTGASYDLTVDGTGSQEVIIPALDDTAEDSAWEYYKDAEDEKINGKVAFVKFENSYDERLNGGTSAINLYQHNETGWYPQRTDNAAANSPAGEGDVTQ